MEIYIHDIYENGDVLFTSNYSREGLINIIIHLIEENSKLEDELNKDDPTPLSRFEEMISSIINK